jgi:hypothetical protein
MLVVSGDDVDDAEAADRAPVSACVGESSTREKRAWWILRRRSLATSTLEEEEEHFAEEHFRDEYEARDDDESHAGDDK